ncbi:hypothetical protein BH11BAC6_BH11BAC6_00770 [soil metagenome]
MNYTQHILLVCCWIIFSATHSIFAAGKVKTWCMHTMKSHFKFYRFYFSILSFLLLGFVVYLTFSIQSILLWNVLLVQRAAAMLLGITGIVIMTICIRKYFFYLSGSSVFFNKTEKDVPLRVDGINKYMRHPLYTGTLMVVWSIFLWYPLLSFFTSVVCITTYTFIGTRFEEKKLIKTFGIAYINYAAEVPMFFPRLRR